MNRYLLLTIVSFGLIMSSDALITKKVTKAKQTPEEKVRMMPNAFTVWARDNEMMLDQPYPSEGWKNRQLPVYNDYSGARGGYVALYTRDENLGVYRVGDDIYVVGLIRVPGSYKGRIFKPDAAMLQEDISKNPNLKRIAKKHLGADVAQKVWFGGDTYGFVESLKSR